MGPVRALGWTCCSSVFVSLSAYHLSESYCRVTFCLERLTNLFIQSGSDRDGFHLQNKLATVCGRRSATEYTGLENRLLRRPRVCCGLNNCGGSNCGLVVELDVLLGGFWKYLVDTGTRYISLQLLGIVRVPGPVVLCSSLVNNSSDIFQRIHFGRALSSGHILLCPM
jgi:hypothetical protein